jgi:hypothetical protein
MSGRIAKSQVPILGRDSLPPDVREAVINVKNEHRRGELIRKVNEFANRRDPLNASGPPLPTPQQGCAYFEWDVGHANDGDTISRRGRKRLVLEVNTSSLEIKEIYYTDEHYAKFSFFRIV